MASDMDMEIYKKLRQHLEQNPIGFPATKSGVELRILKYLFTPLEAEIATYLKFSWLKDLEPLEEIYERVTELGLSIEELEKNLDNMARKGAITSREAKGKKYYANAELMVGIFEYQVDKLTKEFIDDFHQYVNEAWLKQAIKVKAAQVRTIPVEKSVESRSDIADYDNVRKMFSDSPGPFLVANCVCRQLKDIEGEPCKATDRRELCLLFGAAAEVFDTQGWGRAISKEEALEILAKNQEEGLILQKDNSQGLDFICSCCTCCCEGLSKLTLLPNPGRLTLSNYVAHVDPELCTGCGMCLDVCQLDAIIQDNEISKINIMRCVGCGNCASKCPSEAITLVEKERKYTPPTTFDELFEKIIKQKSNINSKK
ncbi:MAG: 4Fe-4S dicluster domain-containing protein [Promethearchaeota archaeon]|nr:MAG: 4Fe-4S dicluster domain-containing protein [Candidatus Lokiarchaeota archaeon]